MNTRACYCTKICDIVCLVMHVIFNYIMEMVLIYLVILLFLIILFCLTSWRVQNTHAEDKKKTANDTNWKSWLPYEKFFVQRRSSNKIISTHYRSCFKDDWHICIIANKTFHESSTNPKYHRKSLCNNDWRDTTVKIKQLNDGWLNTLFMVVFVYIYMGVDVVEWSRALGRWT